jgi:hypothetical protein
MDSLFSLQIAEFTEHIMKPTKGVYMSLFQEFISDIAIALTIRTDKDAIKALLKIIDESNIQLDEHDKAVVELIKWR